jgi:uncharacterized membrane protein YidH (DUF202 family)
MSDGTPTLGGPEASTAQSPTSLAGLRTQLALDRTTLAWIRTSLTMGTFGFGMVGFFRSLRAQTATAESQAGGEGAKALSRFSRQR